MSVLVYTPPGGGAITFGPQGWETMEFVQEPWYEPSQTDCLGVKITISGDWILSAPVPPISSGIVLSGSTNVFDGPAAALPTLRMVGNWARPRGTLSFKENGVEMIPTPPTGKADAKNGPLPGPMRITRLTEKTFRCSLSIVSHWAESAANSEGGLVLSSRWRDSVAIDQDQLSRRTRTGKVIVSSSSYITGGSIIDDLRDTLICTSILPGFIREASNYTLSESGLELSYDFVDQEQFRMCPTLSTFAEGSMLVSTQRMGSPGRMQTVNVTLRGPKKQESNPTELASIAMGICFRKGQLNGGFFPTKADLRESLWKNEVSVTLQGMARPPRKVKAKYRNKRSAKDFFQKFLSLEASLKGFGKTVAGQVGTKSPDPGTRGTGNILLHAAAYNDPTLAKTLSKLDNSLQQGQSRANPNGKTMQVPGG